MRGDSFRHLGKAGEYRVAAELLKRNINVYFPAEDSGVDIITECGERIQVKTSSKDLSRTRGYVYEAYIFVTRSKRYVSSKGVTLRPKMRGEKLDFLVCWCVKHDWFFVIPSKDITETTVNISVNGIENGTSKYKKYLGAWGLLKGGSDALI